MNAKWISDADRANAQNMAADQDPREEPGGVSYLKMQSVLRMIILKVMYENNIDVFVNPENTLPHFKLGGPSEPSINDRASISCCGQFTALMGGPEMVGTGRLYTDRL